MDNVPPVEMKYGLFVGMKEFTDVHQGRILEEESKKLNSQDKAGYIVAKWIKK